MDAQLARIKRNHAGIQKIHPDRLKHVFGGQVHRFRLNPPTTPDVLEAFELRHSCTLPEEYRRFLQEIGNGGAGPFYGLFPLTGNYSESEGARYRFPCLLHPGLEQYGEDWLEHLGITDWETRQDEDDHFPYQGTLTLAEHGCGGYEILILNGPYRGQVFGMSYNEGVPPGPSPAPGSNFLDWYEAWQQAILFSRRNTGFGFTMPDP